MVARDPVLRGCASHYLPSEGRRGEATGGGSERGAARASFRRQSHCSGLRVGGGLLTYRDRPPNPLSKGMLSEVCGKGLEPQPRMNPKAAALGVGVVVLPAAVGREIWGL